MTAAPHMRPNAPDLDAWWMPFTANRAFKGRPADARLRARHDYRTEDGREVLDGTAGLWCVNAGHGREEIAAAVAHGLRTLDYAPPFQMGHAPGFAFAAALTQIAPPGLDRIFFTNSGSESVDTALKIALAHHRARGQAQRTRLIGREKGYHGVGFGGITVGGLVNNRRVFPTLPGADHLPHTHLPQNRFAPACGARGGAGGRARSHRRAARAGDHRRGDRGAGGGLAGVLPPPVGYPAAPAGRLRPHRGAADLRRGDHRLRTGGLPLRRASAST